MTPRDMTTDTTARPPGGAVLARIGEADGRARYAGAPPAEIAFARRQLDRPVWRGGSAYQAGYRRALDALIVEGRG